MAQDLFDNEIMEEFLEEFHEKLEILENDLLGIESNPEDMSLVDSVFRMFHSIKGGAGMLGLEALSKYSHQVENLLSQVRDGKITVNKKLISLLLESADCLRSFYDSSIEKKEIDNSLIQDNLNNITHFTSTPKKAQASAQSGQIFRILIKPSRNNIENDIKKANAVANELEIIGDTRIVRKLESPVNFEIELTSDDASLTDINNFLGFHLKNNEYKVDLMPSVIAEEEIIDKRLGSILVDQKIISENDIKEALNKQKPLGKILVEEGKLSEKELNKALGIQKEQRQKLEALNKAKEVTSIRVDISKLNKLMNLVGEATIYQTQYSQIFNHLENLREKQEHLLKALEDKGLQVEQLYEKTADVLDIMDETLLRITKQCERIMLDIQEHAMNLRMIYVSGLFNSFKRMVRDYTSESGKKINLNIYGEETELDKAIIEQLNDPLKHMIRNSMDHGLEMPEIRKACGKNPQGTITLGASHREGCIIIEVKDDGAGINKEKVLLKAKEKGIISEKAILSENEIFQLLFHPGFSTADKVTNVSGRGVGMDVVKKNIEALSGTIEIKSELNQGTTFKIRLPLTLAIIDGMLIEVGGNKFIIPLLSVVELLKPKSQQLKKAKERGELIEIRGDYFPLIRLHSLLNLAPKFEDPAEGIIIVVEESGSKFALLVDRAVDQQQTVIKNLEEHFYKKEGVAGATILGDGQVSFILDIPGLLLNHRNVR